MMTIFIGHANWDIQSDGVTMMMLKHYAVYIFIFFFLLFKTTHALISFNIFSSYSFY